MKSLWILCCALLLNACSEAPVTHSSSSGSSSSFNGYGYQYGPTSVDDPRLKQPSFYMDESDSIPWLNNAVPYSNR